MFELQYSDVQNDVEIKDIAGCRPESDRFLALVNEVEKSLMIRGGWFDTEQHIRFCVSGCHIVWPEFVGTVLAIKFCGGNVAVSRNGWYSFAPNQSMNYANRGRNFGLGNLEYGGYGNGWGEGYGADVVVEDSNTRPCYNDVSCSTGSYIRYTIVNPNDVGKKITIYGKKVGGQILQERVDGAFVNGVTLTAKNPYAQGFDLVAPGGIQSIVREATESAAYLWEYDPASGTLRDIAVFQPGETNPRYRASRILNIPRVNNQNNNGECCWTPIEAKIKLKFIPIRNERDFIPVDNLRAVRLGIQAVKAEKAGKDGSEFWALAVHELNLELRDKSPDNELVIQNNTFGNLDCPHRPIF